jgi:hypothetical protein
LSAIQRGYNVPTSLPKYLSKPKDQAQVVIDDQSYRLTIYWGHMTLLLAALFELPLTGCAELVPGYSYGNAAAIKPNNVSTPYQFQRNNTLEKARPLDGYFNRA